jgi:uncharacterized membrane protein YdjX (TVP38/TMEM64 family)
MSAGLPSGPPERAIMATRLQRALWLGRWAAVLGVVVGGLIALSELAVKRNFDEAQIHEFVAQFGPAAPIVYVVVFALAGSLIVPTTVLAVVGATFFGSGFGFLYAMLGSFTAAMLGFTAARTLGRRSVATWLARHEGTIARFDRRLESRGFTTALFMRLLYLPNGLINVVCGVSSIRGAVYASATALGLLPMMFAVTFMTEGAKQALLGGDWRALFRPETLLSAALFLVCLSAPFILGVVHRRLKTRSLLSDPLTELSGVFDAVRAPERQPAGEEGTPGTPRVDHGRSEPPDKAH